MFAAGSLQRMRSAPTARPASTWPLCRMSGSSSIACAGGPGLYDAIVAACQRAGFRPKVSDEALRLPSTLNFVAAGLGVSIVPELLRRLNIEGVVYSARADATR